MLYPNFCGPGNFLKNIWQEFMTGDPIENESIDIGDLLIRMLTRIDHLEKEVGNLNEVCKMQQRAVHMCVDAIRERMERDIAKLTPVSPKKALEN
jgi:hypothetical protein